VPPDQALVLAARQGAKRGVYGVDANAARCGIFPGMAVSQAQALVANLLIEEATPEEDEAGLGQVAAWCLRLSPLTAPCPPDGVWIDITGCAHLFGGEAAMLRLVTGRLAETGIGARGAVADTPGCAHAVARYGAAPIVPPGQNAAAMQNLPVAALRLDIGTVEALRRLGFDKVGQLMAAPRGPLARRFGRDALRRLDQALGSVAEPIEPAHPPGLCRSRQSFPEPIATPEDLARVTGLLAASLCEKLRRRDQGACRLDLIFQRVDGTAQTIRVGTAAPSRDSAHLTRLLTAHIETVDPGFGIESVLLAAPLTDRLGARQIISSLTAPRAPDLSGLVDTLLNRLGEQHVFCARPVESDVPERSVLRVPPTARAAGENWPDHLPRPTRLLTPPREIEAVALLPDHAPARFIWRRRAHLVRRADGPERVFGEWWRAAGEMFAVRDYFQVEDEAGQRFWLFRRGDGTDAATGDMRWFLHGWFG
jgi:protein ImuB